MHQHANFKYALANFDRRFERASDGEKGILECKSCTYHKAGDWANGAYPTYYELQLRFYLAVADVNIGAFSSMWGNNPDNDMAFPEITRDKAKEDMIFEKLEYWIWSLEHDVPPTMDNIPTKLALDSLARIYGATMDNEKLTLGDNNWIEYDGIVKEDASDERGTFIDLGMICDNFLDNNVLFAVEQVLDSIEKIKAEIIDIADVEYGIKVGDV